MSDIIFFLLLGLGIGSLYAMLASGLIIVYKGSGVINFAHGALAMYGMFTFDAAWNRGEMFLPWRDPFPTHTVNLPTRITLDSDGSWPLVPSLILALLMAAFLGLIAHFLIFRPLKDAAPLGKVVASVGLMLYLQGVALLNFGTSFPQPKAIIGEGSIDNFLGLGNPFPQVTIYAVAAAVILGVALWLVYQYTRFGLATRAAAGNEKGAILLGYSPQFLAAVNWVAASVLATLTAIIVGPLQGTITPGGLTVLIVPALAAALVGRLSSIPVAIAAGLALGGINTLLRIKQSAWFGADAEWFGFISPGGFTKYIENGVVDSIPLLVIVAVLFFRGRSLPIRGQLEERRLPLAPIPQRVWQHALVWVTVVTLMAFMFENTGSRTIFAGAIQQMLVFAIIMLSMVVLTGYVGQISLAQMSLVGVSAFFMSRMMANGQETIPGFGAVSGPDLPWWIAAIMGIVVAVIVGLALAIPALRIRGVQLAVVTIAAAITIQTLYLTNDQLTGLRAGVPAGTKTPNLFGFDIGARSERLQNEHRWFALFAAIVLATVAIGIANMRRTGTGRRFLAVRANERAAAAAGINVSRTKLLAFGLSSLIAGAGGVMLAFKQVDVSSENFLYFVSLSVLAFAYLGGITSINGGIFAGLLVGSSVFAIGGDYFMGDTNIDDYLVVLGGLGMIVTAIIHPEGVAPFFQGAMRQAGNWLCTSVPGLQAWRTAFAGDLGKAKATEAKAGFSVLVVGFAVFIYWFTRDLRPKPDPDNPGELFAPSSIGSFLPDSGFLRFWVAVALLVAVISVVAIARFGGLRPTLGEAGQAWVGWAKNFGPAALAGYIGGWILTSMNDDWSGLWMPLLFAGVALFIRSIVVQIIAARNGEVHGHDAGPPAVAPTEEPEMAEVS